ncbi:hypothetical protein VZ95_21130, partial [Elstera litoralis]
MPTTINLTTGDDVLTQGDGDYVVNAYAGNDSVTLGSGDSTVNASDGDDTISVGFGDHFADLGDGNNIYSFISGSNTTQDGTYAPVSDPGTNLTIIGGSGNDRIDHDGTWAGYYVTYN